MSSQITATRVGIPWWVVAVTTASFFIGVIGACALGYVVLFGDTRIDWPWFALCVVPSGLVMWANVAANLAAMARRRPPPGYRYVGIDTEAKQATAGRFLHIACPVCDVAINAKVPDESMAQWVENARKRAEMTGQTCPF